MEKLIPEKIINNSEGFDRVGRVIFIKGESDKIFRIISEPYRDFFIKTFNEKKIYHLFNNFLPQTKISEKYCGENNELILEHDFIPDINYLYEWSREMTKDAGIFLLDLNLEMIKIGLYIKDSHAFNITFSNKKPLFFDFGSIEENKGIIKFVWINHFYHNYLFPVKYFQNSDGKKYRNFAIKYLNKPFNWHRYLIFSISHPFAALKTLIQYLNIINECKKIKNSEQQINFLKKLKLILINTPIQYSNTRWRDYFQIQQAKLANKDQWDLKMKSLELLASKITPTTSIDIGGNTGLYTELMAKSCPSIKKNIVTDYDEMAIDLAYKNFPAVHNCYVTDFKILCQDELVNWKPNKETVYPAFSKRNSAELVLMLALIHHLFYFQKTNFSYIVNTLAQLSTKWIILEFISNQDFHVKKWFKKGIKPNDLYNIENLKKELSNQFIIEEVIPSGADREDRYLILARKKL